MDAWWHDLMAWMQSKQEHAFPSRMVMPLCACPRQCCTNSEAMEWINACWMVLLRWCLLAGLLCMAEPITHGHGFRQTCRRRASEVVMSQGVRDDVSLISCHGTAARAMTSTWLTTWRRRVTAAQSNKNDQNFLSSFRRPLGIRRWYGM